MGMASWSCQSIVPVNPRPEGTGSFRPEVSTPLRWRPEPEPALCHLQTHAAHTAQLPFHRSSSSSFPEKTKKSYPKRLWRPSSVSSVSSGESSSAFCLLLRQDSPDSQTRRARKPKLRIVLDTILVSRHELGIFIVYPWVFTGAVVGVPRARGVCFLNTIVRWQFTNFTFPACRQVEAEDGTGGKKVTLAHVVWETY